MIAATFAPRFRDFLTRPAACALNLAMAADRGDGQGLLIEAGRRFDYADSMHGNLANLIRAHALASVVLHTRQANRCSYRHSAPAHCDTFAPAFVTCNDDGSITAMGGADLDWSMLGPKRQARVANYTYRHGGIHRGVWEWNEDTEDHDTLVRDLGLVEV